MEAGVTAHSSALDSNNTGAHMDTTNPRDTEKLEVKDDAAGDLKAGADETSNNIEPAVEMVSPRQRVKVYQLDSLGNWEDKGTGSVSLSDDVWIHVAYEDPALAAAKNHELLLKAKIRSTTDFIRQQDTLIVWTEEDGTDMALSFQEQDGCNDIWSNINTVKRKLAKEFGRTSDPGIDHFPPESDDESPILSGGNRPSPITLPVPSMSNIKKIEEILFAATKGGQIGTNKFPVYYIDQLLPLLEMCEDLDSLEELFSLAHIMKMIVFLNESRIYDYILRDEVFPLVVGILEYDREYPAAKSGYRKLLETTQFKQLVPIPDEEIAQKITSTYRLLFLRDTVLARMLDDATFATLNGLVHYSQADILTWFVGTANSESETPPGEEYLTKVIGVLNEEFDEAEVGCCREDVVLFLHELSLIAKGMRQESLQGRYFRAMARLGLFAIFDYTLAHDDVKIRLAAASILSSILDYDPYLVRSFCLAQVKQEQPQILIGVMIDRLKAETDPGMQSQLAELIRVVLETGDTSVNLRVATLPRTSNARSAADTESDDFLNLFYERCFDSLIEPVTSMKSATDDDFNDQAASLCEHICSILCYIIKAHSYRSKYHVLGSTVTSKIVLLLKAKQPFVRLAALRVFRTFFGMKDEFYNRHLLKHDIFKGIFQCFKDTEGKYNLLNSACLDIFEFIRKENIKSLVTNIVQHHKTSMGVVDYVETFKNLILRYEQNHEIPTVGLGADENEGPTTKQADDKQGGDGWSKMDDDEDAYFNADDDGPESEVQANVTESSESKVALGEADPSSMEVLTRDSAGKVSLGGGVGSSRLKRTASPLGLVDYDDDEEEDIFSSKNRVSMPSVVNGVPFSKSASPVESNSASPGNGSGGTAGRVSFSLQSVATMKRKRSGSFACDEGGEGKQRKEEFK